MRLDRRALLRLAASVAFAAPSLRRAVGQPSDRGIGGTGFAPGDDRGIGGTGVIGTIRKFGSIVVNDLRIAYPRDVDVRIDGRPAKTTALQIGQVVRVSAQGDDGAFSTRRIDVTHEVVGPVTKVEGRRLTVLGQSVDYAKGSLPKIGETVAVSGLRRLDGTIAASLVERAPGAPSRLVGPVDVTPGGALGIGGHPVAGLSPDLVGRRVVVEANPSGAGLVATRATPESSLLPNVRRLSIESYVARSGDMVRLGSGYAVTGGAGLGLPQAGADGRGSRSVVTATVGADGRLGLDSVSTGGRTYGDPVVGPRGAGAGGSGRGGSGPAGGPGNNPGNVRGGDRSGTGGRTGDGGRIPMDFGHDNRGPGGFAPGAAPGAGSGTPGGFSERAAPGGFGARGGGAFGGGGPGGNGLGGGGLGGGGFPGGLGGRR